jgi:hypothetical protein
MTIPMAPRTRAPTEPTTVFWAEEAEVAAAALEADETALETLLLEDGDCRKSAGVVSCRNLDVLVANDETLTRRQRKRQKPRPGRRRRPWRRQR